MILEAPERDASQRCFHIQLPLLDERNPGVAKFFVPRGPSTAHPVQTNPRNSDALEFEMKLTVPSQRVPDIDPMINRSRCRHPFL